MQTYNAALFRRVIDDVFDTNRREISEFELMRFIESNYPEFYSPLGANPSLFKRHFLLFHHLYQINRDAKQLGFRFSISPLSITRILDVECSDEQRIQQHNPLSDFYLDLNNLDLSESELVRMQQLFWQRYLAVEKRGAAINILELSDTENIDRTTVKKAYQRLAQKLHPDKGGSPEDFAKLRQAYLDLKSIL